MRHTWSLVLLAACFHPTPPEGAPCANLRDCPDPLVCDRGLCVRTPGDASSGDGGPSDVAIDADLSCGCQGNTLACGSGTTTTCSLGCMPLSPGARCIAIDPANNVGITSADALTTDITVTGGIATFNTDSGAITGVLARAAGQGVVANIAYEQRVTGTQAIGVWSFHKLTIAGGAKIQFTGARSAVFVVGSDATISGTVDGSGGCYGGDPTCAGPGGGLGGFTTIGAGCGPGGLGLPSAGNYDGGGGGGGGASAGGVGGLAGTAGTGGAAGTSCIAAVGEPLVGGSGGGSGGKGATAGCKGGGGGGALQITAEDTITIDGTITMGGSGGAGGLAEMTTFDGGGGCGGGAGGSILLEARRVTVTATGVLAANGGGGGGGAYTTDGGRGASGGVTASPASGGAGGVLSGPGGVGAAGAMAAGAGGPSSFGNAGAGGGGAGAIYVRTSPGMLTQGGLVTPAAGTALIRTL